MAPSSTRRHFIYTAGAAMTAAQATSAYGANDRIRVGIVGLGGRGGDHIGFFSSAPKCQVSAVCDVDQAARERATARLQSAGEGKPLEYIDMREMFSRKDLDAVSIPLPNHWHALATIWACQAGKDVYVEKPACHNIYEGLRMIEAARKYGRMVQVGSQGRSMPHKQRAIGLLRDGVIGKVYLAKAVCFKRRKSIGHQPDGPVPPGVDWDLFLGPAPMRPFNPLRFKYNWHWFWDTGNGDIGNQGIHEIDIARWALGELAAPTRIISTGGSYGYKDDKETPNTQFADFEYASSRITFEARGLPTGSEGELPPDSDGNVMGNLFYGSDGWMSLNGNRLRVYAGEGKAVTLEEKGVETAQPHVLNFLEAVRTRQWKSLNADIEIGVISASLPHLANASYRLGRRLEFDSGANQCPNDAAANALLTREYRAPYVVPERV
jgi:predicted dehydrogenase